MCIKWLGGSGDVEGRELEMVYKERKKEAGTGQEKRRMEQLQQLFFFFFLLDLKTVTVNSTLNTIFVLPIKCVEENEACVLC